MVDYMEVFHGAGTDFVRYWYVSVSGMPDAWRYPEKQVINNSQQADFTVTGVMSARDREEEASE